MQNAETYGNRNNIGSEQYQNPYNRNADTAPCDFDLRHNSNTSLIYEVPAFASHLVGEVFGHWQLGAIFSIRGGFPFTPATGVDNSLTGVKQDRPNVIGNPYVRDTDTQTWIDTLAFKPNAMGTFGNAGYNPLIGPGFYDLDSNLSRFFPIHERQRFELRFEFFNVLNHTNFNTPVTSESSSTFGKILARQIRESCNSRPSFCSNFRHNVNVSNAPSKMLQPTRLQLNFTLFADAVRWLAGRFRSCADTPPSAHTHHKRARS